MLTEETTVGDPSSLDPYWESKQKSSHRMGLSVPPSLSDLSNYVRISRGIARYGNEICLENINLEVI